MDNPPRHCPHLGLKQNRAIRFASPTPEHRCYVSGEAQDIPVEQTTYCLSSNHIDCPLYMGLSLPSMPKVTESTPIAPTNGIRGWLNALSPRDRGIYGVLLTVLLVIIGIYVISVLNLARSTPSNGRETPSIIAQETETVLVGVVSPTTTATISQIPTKIETNTPTPSATATALMTSTLVVSPTIAVTSTPMINTTATVSQTGVPTIFATTPIIPPTSKSMIPTDTPSMPSIVATTGQSTRVATTTPMDIASPTRPMPVATTPPAPMPTATDSPTPVPQISRENLLLYFVDTSGTMLVPVTRSADVVNKRVATTAMRELVKGTTRGVQRSVAPDVEMVAIDRVDDTITVNLSKQPDDDLSFYAIAMTLSEFPGVDYVQIQVNGQNVGPGGHSGPVQRPILNMDNPQGLPVDYLSGTRFLPLYFLQGENYVRVTRLVPRTDNVAEATVRELLAGPGSYSDRVTTAIPSGTELRSIHKQGSTVVVDLSETFTTATNRNGAVNSLILSLTELRNIEGERIFQRVEVLVEGQSLADYWGEAYQGPLPRPVLNDG